jgi:hypothetical protein
MPSRKRKAKTAKQRAEISKGLKEYWDKKGRKQALKLGASVALGGTALYAAKKGNVSQKLKTYKNLQVQKFGDFVENQVYEATRDPYAKPTFLGKKLGEGATFLGMKAAKGAKRGVQEREVRRVKDTFKNTKEAFRKGADSSEAISVNDPNYLRGRKIGKVYKKIRSRAKKDAEKRKSIFGFSSKYYNFSFEPKENFWIEFEAKKAQKATKTSKVSPAKKQLSAQHRQAISEGLQDYYATIPKKEETTSDKVEKLSKSAARVAAAGLTGAKAAQIAHNIYETQQLKKQRKGIGLDLDTLSTSVGRLARAGKTATETAGLANALYERYQYRNSKKAKLDSTLATVGTLVGIGATGAGAAKSLGGVLSLGFDLASGGKAADRALRQEGLNVKQNADKTRRQAAAIRSRLEREKLKRKDAELGIKSKAVGYYGDLVGASSKSNRPGGTKFEEMITKRSKMDGLDNVQTTYENIMGRRNNNNG